MYEIVLIAALIAALVLMEVCIVLYRRWKRAPELCHFCRQPVSGTMDIRMIRALCSCKNAVACAACNDKLRNQFSTPCQRCGELITPGVLAAEGSSGGYVHAVHADGVFNGQARMWGNGKLVNIGEMISE